MKIKPIPAGPIIGIDPGLQGAIARISMDGKAYTFPMPILHGMIDVERLIFFLKGVQPSAIIVEKQQVFRRQDGGGSEGPVGAFTMGMNYGLILAAVSPYRHFIVRPQTWKTVLGTHGRGKAAAIAYATEHYPDVSLLASPRCRKPSDGMADALCIAAYGKTAIAQQSAA
jgi:crossover junction endodeoxyribonuclease RuvC